MPTRPFLLTDADIIIEAFELGIWSNLVKATTVAIPSVIFDKEASFWLDPETGQSYGIHLEDLREQGAIQVEAATLGQLAYLQQQFRPDFTTRLGDGETEALALLLTGKYPDYLFCTGDALAIKALAMLDLSEQGIAFESALRRVGLLRKGLHRHCTEDYFNRRLADGQHMRRIGLELAADSRFRIR